MQEQILTKKTSDQKNNEKLVSRVKVQTSVIVTLYNLESDIADIMIHRSPTVSASHYVGASVQNVNHDNKAHDLANEEYPENELWEKNLFIRSPFGETFEFRGEVLVVVLFQPPASYPYARFQLEENDPPNHQDEQREHQKEVPKKDRTKINRSLVACN